MYKRNISRDLLDALQDTPVLLVNGAREVGKSTLVQSILGNDYQYYTMDDPSTLGGIKRDALFFLEGLSGPAILDEIQRAPELFLPLKKVVDTYRKPGFFILTGSANVLSLPKLSDSLAGRREIHTLWPLSQGEIQGKKEDFIHTIFNENLRDHQDSLSLERLIEMITTGGYPEILKRPSKNRQKKWFTSYITTILEKDVRDLTNIEGLLELPKIMQVAAARCSGLLNFSELSRSIGIPNTTLKRYISLLEKTYLLVLVPAWSKNLSKRLVKAPKLYLNDTGLLTHLVDFDKARLLSDKSFLGRVLENFIVMELKKQITWSKQRCSLYHYRTHTQQEVDIILETPDSRVVGIEIKLASSISEKDFSGLDSLEQDIRPRFHRGIVLYMGGTIVPFGKNKFALPLSLVWS